MKDYRGSEIQEGCIVAFNKSGDVKIGKVVGFSKPNHKKWIGGKYVMIPDIRIEADDSRGKISSIRHSSSVVVLEQIFPFSPVPLDDFK